ncbi:hypothetical protein [Simkania negevensis]|nr:hypothetical protein [Simkania negevensis]
MKITNADSWTFVYPDMIPISIPVTVKILSSTEAIFEFTFGKESGKISLHLGTLLNDSFQGNYEIPTLGTNSITFKVAEHGKKLIGKPAGFHGPMQWTFTRT